MRKAEMLKTVKNQSMTNTDLDNPKNRVVYSNQMTIRKEPSVLALRILMRSTKPVYRHMPEYKLKK